jgi:hypothetical protein
MVKTARVILARSKEAVDFVLRLAFFGVAPFLIVFAAELFPMTGALVQIGLAVVVFFVAEAVRKFASRSKVVDLAVSGLLEFETYYRAHPPRPLLYYVFYPLLFPYWIAVEEARREFLLFKGYTVATFLFLLASLGAQYWSAFPPQLSVKDFLPIAAGTFTAECVVVLMFLMPIVTSVVHYHVNRAPRRLVLLLLAGVVSVGFAAARIERRRDPIVSYATRTRVRLRSDADPAAASRAMSSALSEAWLALPAAKSDIDTDGKVEGAPLEKARTALTQFFRFDEAHAFDLWFTRTGAGAVMVVYFQGRRGQDPIWLAMDRSKVATHDEARLPPGAFAAMRHASK